MADAAQILFEMIDGQAAPTLESAPERILAALRLPASEEAVGQLRILLQNELDVFVQGILGICDNIGCSLPEDGPLGYTITARPEGVDIRRNEDDYASMWLHYLINRGRLSFELPLPSA